MFIIGSAYSELAQLRSAQRRSMSGARERRRLPGALEGKDLR